MRTGEEAQTREGPETHLIAVGSTGFTILFLSFVVLLWASCMCSNNKESFDTKPYSQSPSVTNNEPPNSGHTRHLQSLQWSRVLTFPSKGQTFLVEFWVFARQLSSCLKKKSDYQLNSCSSATHKGI